MRGEVVGRRGTNSVWLTVEVAGSNLTKFLFFFLFNFNCLRVASLFLSSASLLFFYFKLINTSVGTLQ